jgi:glycosyltransferase involved in cell wall biosynthesis
MTPAAGRVYHGTENYFDFDNLPESWMALARYLIETSDLVICCSDGVACGFATHTRRKDFVTIPNGCEYLKYSRPAAPSGRWPALVADWQRSNRRLAVFAGNINLRLDYGLLTMLAARHPEIGFVFAGPISLDRLSAHQRRVCDALLRQGNVRTLGRLPPEDLPALYWSCDVGILPYRTDMPMLVENGFPLKALEMAAAELPVVSSLMKPLRHVPQAVTVVDSPEAFHLALASHSRSTRPTADREAAARVCRAYDYDALFERMLGELAPRLEDHPPRPGNLADLVASIGVESYRSNIVRFADVAAHPPPPAPQGRSRPISVATPKAAIPLRYRAGAFLSVVPRPVRRLIPISMRRLGRRWMA